MVHASVSAVRGSRLGAARLFSAALRLNDRGCAGLGISAWRQWLPGRWAAAGAQRLHSSWPACLS